MSYDEGVAERIRAIVHNERGVTEKRMFGGLAFLIGGHMALAANSEGAMLLRVDPETTSDLLADGNARPTQMRGKTLTGWVQVDTAGMDDAAFRRWVDIGVGAAVALPPK